MLVTSKDRLCLISFPNIFHFSPTQEHILEHRIIAKIGNTLLFNNPTTDHDKPLCFGNNGLLFFKIDSSSSIAKLSIRYRDFPHTPIPTHAWPPPLSIPPPDGALL